MTWVSSAEILLWTVTSLRPSCDPRAGPDDLLFSEGSTSVRCTPDSVYMATKSKRASAYDIKDRIMPGTTKF